MRLLLAPLWEVGGSFAAVSYTHLDVYKRQVIGGKLIFTEIEYRIHPA